MKLAHALAVVAALLPARANAAPDAPTPAPGAAAPAPPGPGDAPPAPGDAPAATPPDDASTPGAATADATGATDAAAASAATPPPGDGAEARGGGDDAQAHGKRHAKKPKRKRAGKRSALRGDLLDDEAEPELASRGLRFRWLFQTRYAATSPSVTDDAHVAPTVLDGYQLSRIFMRATAKPRRWLESKFLVDFAELVRKSGSKSLKLAYADVALHDRVTASVGLFKRTFSLLELSPIADFELADVGPIDALIKDAELGGRDVGAMLRVQPLPRKRLLDVYVAAMSGAVSGADARVDGLLSARVTTEPVKHLLIGLDGVWRRKGQQPPPGFLPQLGPGKAVSADVSYQDAGLSLRAEWLWGDRADTVHRGDDASGLGGARTFMGAWAIGAYRVDLGAVAIMPALRVEWLDADREHAVGRRVYASGALNVLDPEDQVRVLVDVSTQRVQEGTLPIGQGPGLLDQDTTVFVVQAQIKI